MRNSKAIFVGMLALLSSGCGEQPLMFDSENVLGIDIGVSTTANNPVKLTVAYKSYDASFVPVSALDQGGTYHAIRGCYGVASGGEKLPSCAMPTEEATKPKASVPASATSERDSTRHGHPSIQPVVDQLSPGPPVTSRIAAQAVPVPTGDDGSPAKPQSQAMTDSLSVFSSFNAKADASVNPGGADVGLGKVFATGVAAVQLSEGQNYFLQYKGQSLVYAASECIKSLTKALGEGKVTSSDLKICSAPAPSAPLQGGVKSANAADAALSGGTVPAKQ